MFEKHKNSFLDLSQVEFPSNKLTISQVRRNQPEVFFNEAVMRDYDLHLIQVRIIETIRTEQILASKAWAKAARLADPFPLHSRRDEISYLNDVYRGFGISTGIKQTTELVREFENQAANEAQRTFGKSR